MLKLKLIISAALLLISSAAYSVSVSQSSTVKSMQIYGDPSQNFTDVYFTTCNKDGSKRANCVANTHCSRKSGWVLQTTHPIFEELYSTLIASSFSSQPIGVVGNGTCSSLGFEHISEIFIEFE
ncbi:MAG: hypothetical protein ACFHVJ_15860 [Aestuariibacter sp.]